MRSLSFALFTLVSASGALADTAVTTDAVNLRGGPGTNYPITTTIAGGTSVDVTQCDAEGAWCAVTVGGTNGFVSGKYLDIGDDTRPSWPRTFSTPGGAQITLFQPQVSEWKDFTDLSALVAAEYLASKDAKPAYGVIGVSARTTADPDSDEILLSDIKTTKLDFSTLDRTEVSDLSLAVGKFLPTGTLSVPQERLTASLDNLKRLNDVSGMKSNPPAVFISKVPAILVQTDGKAVFAPVKGDAGLSFAVNTNWDLFRVDTDGTYYLRDEASWLASRSLDGPWDEAGPLPALLSSLPAEDDWKDVKAALPPQPFKDGVVPQVAYSEKPAELVQFAGEPQLTAIPGTRLQWATNSDGAVFFYSGNKRWYVLLSGRWFSSAALDGPWVFATPSLPADFRNLPNGEDYSVVRASVPGTSENAEARLKASIPDMARVATDGSVAVEVSYSGEPKFEPIPGTALFYAVNTNDIVIKVGERYFVLKDGVWFVGDSPTGPFQVATTVPDEVYKIPPSSPVYNATYVRVYSTEPGAVWFGYTLGYLGAYLAWDTLIYGTGWYYPPYWDFGWHGGGYYPYYPRPISYGVNAFYNPVRGTFGRYGYAYGPYRGIAGGAAYNPRTGTYFRGGAVTGPRGTAGFVAAYNPRTNTGGFARGAKGVYGSWGAAGVHHGSDWVRATAASGAAGEAARWHTSAGNQGFIAKGGGGDIYAGRDGNVYRREDGQWQKHTDGGWSPVGPEAKGTPAKGAKARQQIAEKHPAAAKQIATRKGRKPAVAREVTHRPAVQHASMPQHLNLDRAGRLAGNQRSIAHHREFLPKGGGGRFRR